MSKTRSFASSVAGMIAVLAACGLAVPDAYAVLYVHETFEHPDGALAGRTPVPGPGGEWGIHALGIGPVQVSSGAAVVLCNSTAAQDVYVPFADGFALGPGQTMYAAFDVSVDGAGTDVYFAHFLQGTSTFNARVFVTRDLNVGGDFVFGLAATSSSPSVKWGTGLSFNTVYRVVTSYEFDTGNVRLWVDPVTPNSTSIATAGGSGSAMSRYALRQANGNSILIIDNLCAATNFFEALNCAQSAELQIVAAEADPDPVPQGGAALLTVSVTGGNPPYNVIADLSTIGGTANQPLFDDGTNGDVTPDDNVFSYLVSIPCDHPIGPYDLPVEAGDDSCNPLTQVCATSSIALTVSDGTLVLGLPGEGQSPPDDGHPANATRCPGETVSFSAAAQGGGLTYQWFNGLNAPLSDGPTGTGSTISGATTPRLTISNVSAADAAAGPYKVTITRTCDGSSVTTNAASLTIGGPATPVQKQIVISQVYAGGGDEGADYTHDFIELFNRGTTPVNVGGWSVQYASAGGSQESFDRPPRITVLPGVTIQPGKFLLIQGAQGPGGSIALPTPDVIGTIALDATSGKVALVNHSDPLSDFCPYGDADTPTACSIVDFVGYGDVTCAEGGNPAPAPSNTTAVMRIPECEDTDNNGNDFVAAPPLPRNSAAPSTPVILTPPQNALSCVGLTATFHVVAGGPCITGYQWQVNQAPNFSGFVNVTTGEGGTTDTYTTGPLSAADEGNLYRVVITSPYGSIASDPVSLGFDSVTDHDRQVVISQVYGGAGCPTLSCSQYKNDYIELYNQGTSPVNLSGWSVQYASATGAFNDKIDLTDFWLLPGEYYLIQGSGNDNGVLSLPVPHVAGNLDMSATAGKVALVKSTNLLGTSGCTGTVPTSCQLVDLVGYGSANCYEGAGPAPTPSGNFIAVHRNPVCSDTDNNASDFVTGLAAPHTPAIQGNGIAADLNGDGLVNGDLAAGSDDLDLFLACETRDGVPYDPQNLPPGCSFPVECGGYIRPDFDKDGDVDLNDYAVYQRCYNGDVPQTNPNCGN